MIRFENGTIAFDPGDTVADVRTWLQEQAASGGWRAVSVTIATDKDIWMLKRMSVSENCGFGIRERGVECDGLEIRQITAGPARNGCLGVYVTVEQSTERKHT